MRCKCTTFCYGPTRFTQHVACLMQAETHRLKLKQVQSSSLHTAHWDAFIGSRLQDETRLHRLSRLRMMGKAYTLKAAPGNLGGLGSLLPGL